MDYTDWERMKIAGNTEQNRQIDELRRQYNQQQSLNQQLQAYKNISDELKKSNAILQKQIDETKTEAKSANKKSWISIAIAGACALFELISLILKYALGS